jgi:YHS domain-containing protein
MQKDPGCGMPVDRARSAGSSDYNGKTGRVCSASCKQQFDRDLKQYAK